ncbi:hypothetical protein A9K55_002614 [Cordyceps militaris]|uniref:Uncharacterized protein n=1 Tax=Cordyceps militaris TaxID=73501 RepID=A0A2H4S927_CORMI|nr:hypothetical protein A9K55_002614 [Cordyceps militaris]
MDASSHAGYTHSGDISSIGVTLTSKLWDLLEGKKLYDLQIRKMTNTATDCTSPEFLQYWMHHWRNFFLREGEHQYSTLLGLQLRGSSQDTAWRRIRKRTKFTGSRVNLLRRIEALIECYSPGRLALHRTCETTGVNIGTMQPLYLVTARRSNTQTHTATEGSKICLS